MYSLAGLADLLGLQFTGDADRTLTGLATLGEAGPQDLSFLANRKYLARLTATCAGAVIVHPEHAAACPTPNCLLAEDPYLAFAGASRLFANAPQPVPGVHPAATVSADATLAADVSVAAQAVIEAGAVLAAGVVVGAGAYVGHGSRLGAGTRIYPAAVIYHDVHMGEHCVIHSQAVLGADGFGYARSDQGWEKIAQLGGVRLGDRVEIGAGTTIDRGALGHTVIEDGVIIDNQVQVGHNCRIGKNTAIAGCAGLSGSTIIGAGCTLAGGVGVVGHVEICDGVHVTGMTMVTRSITEPGSYSSGTPMTSTRAWKRNAVRFGQLDALEKRLRTLEKQGEKPKKG
jgi:UDP-3-O-[3-hydroxymyristoyl] glucosamine N-acyltransferase